MSELDPDLKRLMEWARTAPPAKPEEVPYGFATRVLAARGPGWAPTLFQELQQSARALSWVSLLLIVCGVVVLASQRSSPASVPAAGLPSALGFLASNLTP